MRLLERGFAPLRCFAALALALLVGASRPRAGFAGRAPSRASRVPSAAPNASLMGRGTR